MADGGWQTVGDGVGERNFRLLLTYSEYVFGRVEPGLPP
jgi:hypothetical protein